MKKILHTLLGCIFVLTTVPVNVFAAYDLTENEIKISKNFMNDGIASYESGDLDEAIDSFTRVLLIDPHNISAQKYLTDIAKTGELTVKQKVNLFKLQDLYANINSLKSRIDYYENMRNLIGRRIVKQGYSSEDLARQMVEIKNDAIRNYQIQENPVQTGPDTKNSLQVLNDALQYEKDQLSLKSLYLTKQYETMRKMDPSFKEIAQEGGKILKSKYKQFKHTNRFYTEKGERIIPQNRYSQDIDLSKYKGEPNDVRQLKRHIALIRREMDQLQESIKTKESKVEKLTEQLVDASLKVTEKDSRLEKAQENLSWQNDKIVDLSSRLDLSQRILNDKSQKIQVVQKSFDNIKEDLKSYESDFIALLSAKDNQIVHQGQSLKSYQEQLTNSLKKAETLTTKLSDLNIALKVQEEKLNQSLLENEVKDEKINNYVGKIAVVERDLKDTQKDLSVLNTKLEVHKEKLNQALAENMNKEEKITEYVGKIAVVEKELKSTKGELSQKISSLTSSENKLSKLQDALNSIELRVKQDKEINNIKVSKLKDEIISLLDQISQNERDLASKDSQLRKFEVRVEKQTAKLSEMEEEIQIAENSIKSVKSLAKRLSDEKKQIQKELARKKHDLDIASAEIEKKEFMISDQKKTIEERDALIHILDKEKIQLTKSVSNLEKDLAFKSDELDQAHNELFEKITMLNQYKVEKEDMESLLTKYKKDLNSLDKENAKIKAELASSESVIARNEDSLSNLDKSMKEVQGDLSLANKKIKDLQKNQGIKRVQKDLEEKDKSIAKMKAQLEKKDDQLQEKDTVIEQKALDISQLKKDLAFAQDSLDQELKAKEKLTQELMVVKKELEYKVQVVKEQDKEIESLQVKFEKAQKDMNKIADGRLINNSQIEKNVVSAKDQKIASLQRELQSLQDIFNSTKLTIRKQKKEIAALKRSFEENYHSDAVKMAFREEKPQAPSSNYSVDSIINDLITLNSEIIRLQGTYTNKTANIKQQQKSLKSVVKVLSQANRITQIVEDKANAYIISQGHQNNELKGILDIYKDKLKHTNASLKKSEATVATLKDQIAFAQKQLFEKDKLLKKTQNDLVTLEEELSAVKDRIQDLKSSDEQQKAL